jgi:hypothetical protein
MLITSQVCEDNIASIMNIEIARELMKEEYPDHSEENFQKVWEMSKGKPFDVPVI